MADKSRFSKRKQSYEQALSNMLEFPDVQKLNKFEQQGLIQCFEYTFELGWKTLKDWLEAEGFSDGTPRSVIQRSFQLGLIGDGHSWIKALDYRDFLSHAYSQESAQRAVQWISHTFLGQFIELRKTFEKLEAREFPGEKNGFDQE